MRATGVMFWVLAGFFIVETALYTGWNLIDHGTVEWAGTIAIGLSAVLCMLISFFLFRSRRAQGGELAEDRPDAAIDDGDPEVGFYSPWSWWPLLLASSSFLVLLGFAIGIWITFIGAAVLLVSLVGWQYEYYRGHFAR